MKTANIRKCIAYTDLNGNVDEKIISEAYSELKCLQAVIKFSAKEMQRFFYLNEQLIRDNVKLSGGKYQPPY